MYGPPWSTMYKHLGSPKVNFGLQKGKIKIEKKEEKSKMEKINRYKKVVKNSILHKLTHLSTNSVLVSFDLKIS